MYPDFPNTLPHEQQVIDLKLARELKAYAKSWLEVMDDPHTVASSPLDSFQPLQPQRR